jgi:hypothetical protein
VPFIICAVHHFTIGINALPVLSISGAHFHRTLQPMAVRLVHQSSCELATSNRVHPAVKP